MERDIIKYEKGGLIATASNVLMTSTELGSLFGVRAVKIDRTVQKLIKKGVLNEYKIYKTIPVEGYSDGIVRKREVYDMDVIIALTYELDNCATHFFRKWVVKKVTSQQKGSPAIIIQYEK